MPRGGHTKRNYLHLSKLRRQTQNKITNITNTYLREGGRERGRGGGRERRREGEKEGEKERRREEGREKKGTEERKRRSSTFN